MSQALKMTKEEWSWALYDVANSAFVLVMVTAIMPMYYKDVVAASQSAAVSTANWGFANSLSSLILAVLSPILGAMADYEGKKKRFFLIFLFLGLGFNLLLPFVQPGQWLLCLLLFILARIGWAGSNIFYDAFLVDVTTRERMDWVSARGYGYGYIGSVIPFLFIIALLFSAGAQGALPIRETKIGFFIVSIWWLLFSIPAMKHVRQKHSMSASPTPVRDSLRRVAGVMKEARRYPQVFLFLLAYFFYIDGVDTLISMATAYGRDLGFSVNLLIGVLLVIQLAAFPFALFYGRLAMRIHAKRLLLAGIGVYCLATVLAFWLPAIETPRLKVGLFWLIALLVASSMGGIQALSRSFFGKLIPPEKSAEFFGFYNIFGKFAAILGPFLMGLVGRLSGDSRWGVLSLLLLFILGGIFLSRIDPEAALSI